MWYHFQTFKIHLSYPSFFLLAVPALLRICNREQMNEELKMFDKVVVCFFTLYL
jgi:hypothetical protein